jgi:hypothetical protein
LIRRFANGLIERGRVHKRDFLVGAPGETQ